MSIQSTSDLELDRIEIEEPRTDRVHSSEREDAEQILNTREVWQKAQPLLQQHSPPLSSLNHEVSSPRLDQLEEACQRCVKDLSPERRRLLEEKLDLGIVRGLEEVIEDPRSLPPSSNVLARLDRIVALLLEQLQRVSEKDKTKVAELEKTYKERTLEASTLQKQIGWSGAKSSVIALAASFLQFVSPHEADRALARIFAEKVCPSIGQIFSSNLNAQYGLANNECTRANTKLQEATTASQDASSTKQQIISALEKAAQALQAASRFS